LKKSGRLLTNSILNLTGNAIPLIVGVIAIPPIVRGMGVERFGILSLCWIFFSYFGIFDLGIGRASIKFISEADASGDKKKIAAIFWTSFYSQIFIGAVLGILTYFLVPYLVKEILKMPAHLTSESIASFRTLGVMLPVILVSSGIKNLLEALQRFDLVNYIKVPSNILFFVIPALLPTHHLSFVIFMLGMVRLVSAISYGALAKSILPDLLKTPSFNHYVFKSILTMGFWITISSLASPVLLYVERFFITSLSSVGDLTYYSVSYDTLSRITLIAVSAAAALYPAFSFENAAGDRGKTGELLIRPLKYLLIIMTPIVFILYMFSDIILLKWLGTEFLKNGITVFRILLITFYINSLAVVPFTAVQGLGRADLKAKFDVIGSVIFIALIYILVKYAGIKGAAAGKGILMFADFIFLMIIAVKISGLKLSATSLSGGKFVKILWFSVALILSGIAITTFNNVKNIFPSDSQQFFLLMACLSFLFCGAYLYAVLRNADEKDYALLKNIRSSILRKHGEPE